MLLTCSDNTGSFSLILFNNVTLLSFGSGLRTLTTELIVEQLQPQICEYSHEATGSVFTRSSVYVRRAVFSKYGDNGFIHFDHGQSPASVLKFVLSCPTAQCDRGAVSWLSVELHLG